MSDYKPKLIEVALPLLAINRAAAAEGSIGQRPHPKNLHRWWARRPLPAARAVVWASLVDDPSCDPTLDPAGQEVERQRLFRILERLVEWKESDGEATLVEARRELDRCYPDGLPPILDPFGGGGAIPLEAQRLGLSTVSGDLNPVAVLIQKSMIEIPLRFVGRSPIHPNIDGSLTTWDRNQGLAADVEAYGTELRDQAEGIVGHLYPKATDRDGRKLTPIAWIWARTIESPDPTWRGQVPLVASWELSKKKGNPKVWIEPVIDRVSQRITYRIRSGGEPSHERTVTGGRGTCIATGATIPAEYIKRESRAGRLGHQMMAIVADRAGERTYVSPSAGDHFRVSVPAWLPRGKNPKKLTGGTVYAYGFDEWWKLFSLRQLTSLTTFSDLLSDVHERVVRDARKAGLNEGDRLRAGGDGAVAYADAVVTYLAFAIDKMADFGSTLCSWNAPNSQLRYTFARQAIPMTWDYAEVNPFSRRMASWDAHLQGIVRTIDSCLGFSAGPQAPVGRASQRDAVDHVMEQPTAVVCTDPPYYANISYADLSDFFYVWLRHSLKDVWPDELSTLLTPKSDELIANQHRAGSRQEAEHHFESGMARFMLAVAWGQPPSAPATIFYAYKATETKSGEIVSTGWATFLQAILDAGLQVTSTWPLRTERQGRLIAIGANALASSIVLSCRKRPDSAPLASRGEFIAALRDELPDAVRILQTGNIAPVDLPQSTIGPGIKVFSRYAKVVEADGSAMRVSAALSIINDVLAEVIDGEESELDADTRFAVSWYAQHGWNPASSGEADGLARAKNTSLVGLGDAGVGEARAGKFRLFERGELEEGWDPTGDERLTVWEATQYLVAALERSETEAAELLKRLGGVSDRARQLAYVLFQRATDNGWAEEATAYNGLITAWPQLRATAATLTGPAQDTLL